MYYRKIDIISFSNSLIDSCLNNLKFLQQIYKQLNIFRLMLNTFSISVKSILKKLKTLNIELCVVSTHAVKFRPFKQKLKL